MKPRRRGAFTLLEVLAVVLLTSIVIGVALDHYVNLSRASTRAAESTRDVRRATAILDRVARDIENVVLMAKADEDDPLAHPWIFLGESHRSELGSDHLKFVSLGRRQRGASGHGSDLEMVVYALRRSIDDDDEFELMRWSSPRLPEGLDRELPSEEADGAQLLSDEIAAFGVTFVDEAGEVWDTWDSSQLQDSSELPVAVDIEVAMWDPEAEPEDELRTFQRRVVLPVRPLDPVEIFDPVSLVSGGSGTLEDFADKPDPNETPEDVLEQCASSSPCANMTACQAIGCNEKLGLHGDSIDLLIEQTMRRNLAFCQWQHTISPALRWLIDNPECR